MPTSAERSADLLQNDLSRPGTPLMSAPSRTVLVVEDDPALLNVLTRFLELAEIRVIPAEDAETALRLAAEAGGEFDMAVLDYNLPDGDGGKLYDQLLERFGEKPVCFISGDDTMGGALETHANAMCLAKPFSPRQLVELVHAITNS